MRARLALALVAACSGGGTAFADGPREYVPRGPVPTVGPSRRSCGGEARRTLRAALAAVRAVRFHPGAGPTLDLSPSRSWAFEGSAGDGNVLSHGTRLEPDGRTEWNAAVAWVPEEGAAVLWLSRHRPALRCWDGAALDLTGA